MVMSEIYLSNPTDRDFANLEGKAVSVIRTNGSNSEVTNASLESISKINGLRELDLEWATGITDAGLPWLHSLHGLEYIDLSFCNGITEAGISGLRAALPKCNVDR